jgi:hypothetical protein
MNRNTVCSLTLVVIGAKHSQLHVIIAVFEMVDPSFGLKKN